MQIQDVITKWKSIGEPTSDEIESGDHESIAEKAFSYFKSHLYNYVVRELTTEVDTAEYSLPSTAIKNIPYVYPISELTTYLTNTVDGDNFYSLLDPGVSSGVSIWTDLYLMQEVTELKMRLMNYTKKTRIMLRSSQLLVIPKPTEVKVLVYVSKEEFIWSSVLSEMEYIIEDLYCAEQLLFLATKRMSAQGVTITGSNISYPGDKLSLLSDKYQKKADNSIEKYNDRLLNLF